MYKFFVSADAIGADVVTITGEDVNHIKNVLRMQPGEAIFASAEDDREYACTITQIMEDAVIARIDDVYGSNRELPARIVLFQGLPKGDKMETIIQKAVELGAYAIVPVATRRSVVKLDGKKQEKKLQRWNAIAQAAAKQSKRNRIPKVEPVVSFSEAVQQAEKIDQKLIPYENAQGIAHAKAYLSNLADAGTIGVFIGPEGGFAPEEIQMAMDAGIEPITLGHRILRTETAAMTVLSLLMFLLERDDELPDKQ